MPFKANADRRHNIPKQRRRVTNWAEYDAALRQRGSLTGHRRLDQLWSRQGRRGRSHEGLCPSGHAGDRGPGLEGLGSGGSILTGGAVIAAEVEQVVDLIVSREEPLGLAG